MYFQWQCIKDYYLHMHESRRCVIEIQSFVNSILDKKQIGLIYK